MQRSQCDQGHISIINSYKLLSGLLALIFLHLPLDYHDKLNNEVELSV